MSASSGESVILRFKFRPKTKFFGNESYGLTTGNQDYTLSHGAMMFVCVGKMTDRLGHEYGNKLYPDVTINDDSKTGNNEVIDEAVKWIRTKK